MGIATQYSFNIAMSDVNKRNSYQTCCYHCDEVLIDGQNFYSELTAATEAFCCPACVAVFECISDGGFQQYYKRRDQKPNRPEFYAVDYQSFDSSEYIKKEGANSHITLLVKDIHCSACSWLIESCLQDLPGVKSAQVNVNQRSVAIHWDNTAVQLSAICCAMAKLGYHPQVWSASKAKTHYQTEKKQLLQRLGIAGILMMQIGMLAIGLYAGDIQGMDTTTQLLLRSASCLLCSVAIALCCRPLFVSAQRSLANKSPNMDVPISLAIVLTYAASVFNLLRNTGEVYFDTVAMFLFFVLLSRFIELLSRNPEQDNLTSLIAQTTLKRTAISGDGNTFTTQACPSHQLQAGDIVLCPKGERVPIDGKIINGHSAIDNSIFTGESDSMPCQPGDSLRAGQLNLEQPLWLCASVAWKESYLFTLDDMLNNATQVKPKYSNDIEKLTPFFIVAVLLIALLTAIAWLTIDSSQAFNAVISVLVASCPCALALSTPLGMANANRALRQIGLAPQSGRLLERLAECTSVFFDKTGTLTQGDSGYLKANTYHHNALALALAIEQESNHPLAVRISHYCKNKAKVSAGEQAYKITATNVVDGCGIEAIIGEDKYRIGKGSWCNEILAVQTSLDDEQIHLVSHSQLLASFDLGEQLRPDANEAVAALAARNINSQILSGDNACKVSKIADLLNIQEHHARLMPTDKLRLLRKAQTAGECVLVVGDGLNDNPMLAAADVSIAMGSASSYSKNSADGVLLSNRLSTLVKAIELAQQARKVIRQNMCWAITYNVSVIPLAALGFLTPWMAAIGMSLSSLIVVLNSARLRQQELVNSKTSSNNNGDESWPSYSY